MVFFLLVVVVMVSPCGFLLLCSWYPDGCGCRGCWLRCRWWLWREGSEGGVFWFCRPLAFSAVCAGGVLVVGGGMVECVLMPSAGFMVVGVGGGVKFVGVSACFSFRCGFGRVLLSAGASGFVACVCVSGVVIVVG